MQDSIRTFWILLIRDIKNDYQQLLFFKALTFFVKKYLVALARQYGNNGNFVWKLLWVDNFHIKELDPWWSTPHHSLFVKPKKSVWMTHFQPLSRIFVFQIYIVQKLWIHENRWVTKEKRLGLYNLCFLLARILGKTRCIQILILTLFLYMNKTQSSWNHFKNHSRDNGSGVCLVLFT